MKSGRVLIAVSIVCVVGGLPVLLDVQDSPTVAGPRMYQSFDCFVDRGNGSEGHTSCYELTGSDADCAQACGQFAAATGGISHCTHERNGEHCTGDGGYEI